MTQFSWAMSGLNTVGASMAMPNGINQYWQQYPYYRVYRVDWQFHIDQWTLTNNLGGASLGATTHVGLDTESVSEWEALMEQPGFKWINFSQDYSYNTSFGRTLKGTVYLPRVKAQSSAQFKADESNRVQHGLGDPIGDVSLAASGNTDNHVFLEIWSNVPGLSGAKLTGTRSVSFTFYVEWFGTWPDRSRTQAIISS